MQGDINITSLLTRKGPEFTESHGLPKTTSQRQLVNELWGFISRWFSITDYLLSGVSDIFYHLLAVLKDFTGSTCTSKMAMKGHI